MIIEKMTFYNFKSYYDKVELGPFHESFTAIVGANGCGKSNVIDGLLFVFGRRAKQIRQQKVVDLIHKSALHPNCTEARVDVHLISVDTEGSYLPDTRFTVTRTVFRDGTSKFMIDGVVCKFDAVLEKMKSKGFDLLNNRFLILQGEVERIALMPARSKNGEDGMLEFLEDIIGTSQYIEEIEKGTSELEKLNDEVHEKTNRFKIIERERNGILKEKENAISYLKEEYKMCGLKNSLNKQELKSVEEKEVESKEEREKLEKKRKVIQNIKNEKLIEKTAKDKVIEEKGKDIKKIEKEYETQKSLVNSAKKKKARAEEEKKQNEKAVLRNEKEIKEMEKKIKDEKEKIESKQRRYNQLSKTIEKDKEEIEKLKNDLEKQTNEIKEKILPRRKMEEKTQKTKESTIKQEQLNDLKKKNKELKKRIEKGGLDIEAREREITRICKEFEIKKQTSEEEIQKIEEQNKVLFEQLEQKQKELEKLEGIDVKIIKVNLQDINERNKRSIKEYNRIELEISGSTSKIDEWNSYLKEMNIHLEELKNRMEKDEIKIDETQMKLTKKELNEKTDELKKIEEEYEILLKKIEELETEEDKIKEQIEEINGNNSELTEKRQHCEKEIRSIFKHIRELLHIAEIHEEDEYIKNMLNHNETDNQMDEEKIRIVGISLKDVVDELKEINRKEVLAMIEDEKKKIENMIENVNLKIIATFIKVNKEYQEKWDIMNEAIKKQEDCKSTLEALKKKRFDEFINGLTEISFKLKEMYYLLTQGGVAELELVDTLNPFTEGVVFSVRPPKKAWKNITNLSGGEKTLSSLALIFALHHYKPTPIYVMDEIDAALDFRNVSIIAHYIKERTKNAQFTIISLRPEMFELADRLMGVYKVKDVSCSVSFDPNAYNLNNN
ncbi:structural maintenance of chromosomes protein, putative [Entamoeba dispar SAW760]|uniref:Structural maintenance of chromosomes protein 4 n=1 Tax=Entamoeba dispar (strain ATCC PRA-260 / SAW760) TaxID=370354 RepID=B0EKJ7_ENTDS|nr:structural maintenance of chromosomes protein, putative [Entamoeba dispar SAW760]EDR24948.1 structural maintenance of chromosomes protein, putative [Entamoeba dispar SAW760]|eukprot:EDR24948.1 structural maintenance of chromosomes protein, putative [Entamoeba dispar SAW760]